MVKALWSNKPAFNTGFHANKYDMSTHSSVSHSRVFNNSIHIAVAKAKVTYQLLNRLTPTVTTWVRL